MISERYRQLNAALHKQKPEYGVNGRNYASDILRVVDVYGGTVLDYGCGKGTLCLAIGCAGYDPAVVEFSAMPEPADIVVCTDVLEHVEPEHIDSVLDHINSLTRKAAFFVISLRPANKFLADGRNAHLIIESDQWWRDKLAARFVIKSEKLKPNDELVIIAEVL